MATQPRLPLPNDGIVEFTRRSTNDDAWARYLLLLQVANGILEHAPQGVQECEDLDILKRLGDDLEAMVTAIHQLLPGGLMEAWHYYLPERFRKQEDNGNSSG